MVDYLVRIAKRFAVLIPGIVIAIVSVRDIFPWFDKNLPLAFAVLLTYIVAAYILIPALIRIIRFVAPARHLQPYCVTPDGFASDPVNIGVIGSRSELVAAMQAAGWAMADDYRLRNLLRAGISMLLNQHYPAAPMSRLYLFGRKQDIGFEKEFGGRGQRHHVRFWATAYRDSTALSFGSIDWHKQRRQLRNNDTRALWVGAASRDIGFAFIRHNVQITHMIAADTDAERQLIVSGLKRAGMAKSVKRIRLRRPYSLMNRAWRGVLQSDGLLEIVRLKTS